LSQSKHIWPENESPCIWMEAGIIDYKLCDHNYDCDHCPFDKIMRAGNIGANTTSVEKASSSSVVLIETDLPDSVSDLPSADKIFSHFNSFHFNPECYYGYDFWFVNLLSPRRALIGLNELGLRLISSVREIILPQQNAKVQKGIGVCWLIFDDGTICLPSPITGTINRINANLLNMIKTSRSNRSQAGWWFDVSLSRPIEAMIKGPAAKDFLEQQQLTIIKGIADLLKKQSPAVGQTLQDGGALLSNPEDILGKKKYFSFLYRHLNCTHR